jgi:hypothetical protein
LPVEVAYWRRLPIGSRIWFQRKEDRQECRSERKGSMRSRFAFLAIFAILGSVPGAYAQSCALCYTTASAAGAAAQRSLDLGILALLAPALTLFLGVMFLLYRRAVSSAV